MPSIVTLTMNPAVDKSTTVDDLVAERKLRCGQPRREPGGGGINVARAIRKLDGEATAVFPAGGPTGDMLETLLRAEEVALARITTDAWTRENLTVYEESTGQQFRFGMPGPELTGAEWQTCLDRLFDGLSPKFVVASGSLPPGAPADFYGQVGAAARDHGARFLLDTSGAPLRAAADQGVFLLKPNAREFAELTGESFETEEQQERLARDLVDRNACDVLVLSLGAAGVLLVTHDHTERMRSPSVPIRSKVGAGDSMMAAIVLALARDMDIRSAVAFGVAAGAAAVMTSGTELCRKADAERLFERLRADNGM